MSEIKQMNYEKLTPQRKSLIDEVLANLKKGKLLWKQNWKDNNTPESLISGKKYRGMNNLYLTIIALKENYQDNRWLTFHQMQEKGWSFKTNEEGKSLAKGKGVPIEYFEFRDKKTKKPFTKISILGLSPEEQEEYWKENVVAIRKYYRVFNGDLVNGIPKKERKTIQMDDVVERAEKILDYWNQCESKIYYGNSQAYYQSNKDEIHVPNRESFLSMQDFYSTVLHEIGHSTGHEKRLNRDLSGAFGSSNYAIEELRAEIASMFMEQELGIAKSGDAIENNSAYIQFWYQSIKDNPNVLFSAVADADKISKFVLEKEKTYQQNHTAIDSDIYELPSNISNKEYENSFEIRCDEKSLMKMSDREVVEKASQSTQKDKFLDLYQGKKVLKSHRDNALSLMMRIAAYCSNDKEQLLRIFKTSGQFNENKESTYYEKLASKAMDFVNQTKDKLANETVKKMSQSSVVINSKSK